MKIIDIDDRADWDDFITSHKEANFLQSWDFYEFHKSRGKKVVRRGIVNDDGRILAAYAGVVETAKRGTHMAIAGGPIVDWGNKEVVHIIFDDIRKAGEEAGCVFVRIRPQLPLSDQSLNLMRELGLKKSPMYLSVEYAGILDLTKSESDILAGASQGNYARPRRMISKLLQIPNRSLLKNFVT